MLWLELKDLPKDVATGHALEVVGLIEHNNSLANGMNDYSRALLREAEAFAAGMALGRKEGGKG